MKERMAQGAPVISVDTKKKELVGDFKNGGRRVNPSRSAFTTSSTRTLGGPCPAASTILPITRAG